MEKVKEFISSPKKTVILGLIGSAIMLLLMMVSFFDSIPIRYLTIGYFIRFLTIQNMYSIAFIIYFAIVLMRMHRKKGNIKIANYILIGALAINTLISFISTYSMVNRIIVLAVNIITILYLLNILFRKPTKIDNKMFAIALIVYALFNILSSGFNVFTVIYYIGYLAIIPYFYNYYELLTTKK